MGTSGKDRQAAFKAKRREEGKRQITIWVTEQQGQSVKNLLTADPQQPIAHKPVRDFSKKDVQALCLLDMQFGLEITAGLVGMDQTELLTLLSSGPTADLRESMRHLYNTERDLIEKGRESDFLMEDIREKDSQISNLQSQVAELQEKVKTRRTPLTSGMTRRDRAAKLMELHTTERDYASGGRKAVDTSWTASRLAQEMKELTRKTKSAGTSIAGLLNAYKDRGLLSEKEAKSLSDTGLVLLWLGTAADDATKFVSSNAKKIKEEEELRDKQSSAVANRIYTDLSVEDRLLVLFWLGERHHTSSFLTSSIESWDARYHRDALKEEALGGIRYRIVKNMKSAGKTAEQAAHEEIESFMSKRNDLLQHHGDTLKEMITKLVSMEFLDANSSAKK